MHLLTHNKTIKRHLLVHFRVFLQTLDKSNSRYLKHFSRPLRVSHTESRLIYFNLLTLPFSIQLKQNLMVSAKEIWE